MSVEEIRVCLNNRGQMRYSCMASDARATLKEVKGRFGEEHKVRPWTCMGHCHEGPMICVVSSEKQERYITKGDLEELGKVVKGHVD